MISAGKLRYQIDILRQSSEINHQEFGEQAESWTPILSSISASFKTLGGRELERAKQVVAEATHQFEIRFRDGIDYKDRIQFKGRTFAIGHVDNVDELDQLLAMTCTEIKG